MRYKSTRGMVNDIGFTDAFLMGLATDGGLLIPQSIPIADLNSLSNLSYKQLTL